MQFLKWLYPGLKVKRWLLLFGLGVMILGLGLATSFNYQLVGAIEENIFRVVYLLTGKYSRMATLIAGLLILAVGAATIMFATRQIIRSVISVLLPNRSEELVEIILQQRKLIRGPSVVVIGGGTGLSVLLRGIKKLTNNVTAIVTVADDGGSSGRIREDLNIIPPGDLRNCLVALADTEPLMEKLFQHRFGGTGNLAGHSFGNLYIAAMTEILGDAEKALQESSKILKVRGKVLPSSAETLRLSAEMSDGEIVEGESNIPNAGKTIKRLSIVPHDAQAVESALKAISEADLCILGPGSLYTSILPNLLVEKVAETIRDSEAIKLYICNVMTQPGETDGYTAADHLQAIVDHGGSGLVDYVLVNVATVAEPLRKLYELENSYPVAPMSDTLRSMGVKVIEADLISETNVARHDPTKLSEVITQIMSSLRSGAESMKMIDYYFKKE